MFLLKISLRPWVQTPWNQAFGFLTTSALLFLGGFFIWLQFALGPVVERFKNEQVLTVYVNGSNVVPVSGSSEAVSPEKSSPSSLTALVDQIRQVLSSKTLQEPQLQVSTPEMFLEEIKGSYPELRNQLLDLGHELTQIVPHYISISGRFQEGALDELKKIPGVEWAESSRHRYAPLLGAFEGMRWTLRIFALGLILALLTELLYLSHMNGQTRKEILPLMKLWGGSEWTLWLPSLTDHLLLGFFAGALAAVFWWVGTPWGVNQLRVISPFFAEIRQPSLLLGGMLWLAGIIFSVTASLFSHFFVRVRRGA